MGEKKKITQGVCRFCGQMSTVAVSESQQQADERASEECNCPGASQQRAEEEARVEMENKRKTALDGARKDIEDLFGPEAATRNMAVVTEDIRQKLYTDAVDVYDEKLRRVSKNIFRTTTATITKTDKDRLTIQRDESLSIKRQTQQ